jgi:hypothetical protein
MSTATHNLEKTAPTDFTPASGRLIIWNPAGAFGGSCSHLHKCLISHETTLPGQVPRAVNIVIRENQP